MQAPNSRSQPSRVQPSPASSGRSLTVSIARQPPGKAVAGRGDGHGGGKTLSPKPYALLVAAEFPPALRLYALFLEAADSHRLNCSLVRWLIFAVEKVSVRKKKKKKKNYIKYIIYKLIRVDAFLVYAKYYYPKF